MFGQRLKTLREQSNMTQEEVSDKINITARTLGNYENEDRRPNPETLTKLANFYNVTTDYILGLSDNPHTNSINTNAQEIKETISIPILGNIRAGRPLFTEEHMKGELLMPRKTLTDSFQHFILEVIGDSMTGDNISEGDLVLIRVQDYIDYEGQIAAVIIDDDESCLKHIYISDDKEYIILRSSNPKYPDIVRPNNQVYINGVLTGFFKQTL